MNWRKEPYRAVLALVACFFFRIFSTFKYEKISIDLNFVISYPSAFIWKKTFFQIHVTLSFPQSSEKIGLSDFEYNFDFRNENCWLSTGMLICLYIFCMHVYSFVYSLCFIKTSLNFARKICRVFFNYIFQFFNPFFVYIESKRSWHDFSVCLSVCYAQWTDTLRPIYRKRKYAKKRLYLISNYTWLKSEITYWFINIKLAVT